MKPIVLMMKIIMIVIATPTRLFHQLLIGMTTKAMSMSMTTSMTMKTLSMTLRTTMRMTSMIVTTKSIPKMTPSTVSLKTHHILKTLPYTPPTLQI